jgi:hypothetical protein
MPSSDGDGVTESVQVTSCDGDNLRLQDLPATGVVITAPSAANIVRIPDRFKASPDKPSTASHPHCNGCLLVRE